MFGLRKSERQAYEAHIASLNEQIHWLRSCIPWVVPVGSTAPAVRSGPGAAPPPTALPVDEQDDLLAGPRGPLAPMSEEEEDVLDMYNRGDLDTEEAKALLATLGVDPATIEFK